MALNGKVETWFMSKEELQEKFGPEAGRSAQPKTRKPEKVKDWRWTRITKAEYVEMKTAGKLDSEIMDKHEVTYERLQELKKKWGLLK